MRAVYTDQRNTIFPGLFAVFAQEKMNEECRALTQNDERHSRDQRYTPGRISVAMANITVAMAKSRYQSTFSSVVHLFDSEGKGVVILMRICDGRACIEGTFRALEARA
jgi:hypothetical protein